MNDEAKLFEHRYLENLAFVSAVFKTIVVAIEETRCIPRNTPRLAFSKLHKNTPHADMGKHARKRGQTGCNSKNVAALLQHLVFPERHRNFHASGVCRYVCVCVFVCAFWFEVSWYKLAILHLHVPLALRSTRIW